MQMAISANIISIRRAPDGAADVRLHPKAEKLEPWHDQMEL